MYLHSLKGERVIIDCEDSINITGVLSYLEYSFSILKYSPFSELSRKEKDIENSMLIGRP